jgi:hypothetical protein
MSDRLRRQVVYNSGFSLTRIMIHAVCLLRRPGKATFFFACIRREFPILRHRYSRIDDPDLATLARLGRRHRFQFEGVLIRRGDRAAADFFAVVGYRLGRHSAGKDR